MPSQTISDVIFSSINLRTSKNFLSPSIYISLTTTGVYKIPTTPEAEFYLYGSMTLKLRQMHNSRPYMPYCTVNQKIRTFYYFIDWRIEYSPIILFHHCYMHSYVINTSRHSIKDGIAAHNFNVSFPKGIAYRAIWRHLLREEVNRVDRHLYRWHSKVKSM